MEAISPLRVIIANGSILECRHRCADISLLLQSHYFTMTLHVLPISGANMVLGIDWLKELGTKVTNYTTLSMKFNHLGHFVELCTDVASRPIHSSTNQIKIMLHKGSTSSTSSLFHFALQPTNNPNPCPKPPHPIPEIQDLITKFAPIFLTPMTIPPPRHIVHHISLSPSTSPINVLPYRYPYFQKSIIEK